MKPRTFLRLVRFMAPLVPMGIYAQDAQPQSTASLQTTARAFLEQQLAGQPGEIRIKLNGPDSRTKIKPCLDPEAYLPNGARLYGRTTVGVRCTQPNAWQVFIPAEISIKSTVWVANHPLSAKSIISAADLRQETIDVTNYPNAVVTQLTQVLGKTLNRSIAAGLPLRLDALQSNDALTAGETVRVQYIGQGFKVSSEGKVISNAEPGQAVQVRMPSGQIISGTAKAGKIVELIL